MSDLYILDGHTPVPVTDVAVWGKFCEDRSKRRVARTEIGDVTVSTVFLGINHNFVEGEPILFETMVFGGEHDEYQERCCTWDEAVAMHTRVVTMVEES